MENLEIIPSEDTLTLLGLKCQKAVAKSNKSEEFEVFYTNDIEINNPYKRSPYNSINGVLIKFRMKFGDSTIELIARNVQAWEISLEEFVVPTEYKRIQKRENMENVIDALFE